ncbi:MAG: hypothetical protein ABSE73_03585 [Planctomycetota bacterium]
MSAIAERADLRLEKIVQRREELMRRLRILAQSHPQEVAACAELSEAAKQEPQLTVAARARQEEIRLELEDVLQRIAIRQTYL